jgi:hypothetical protein
MLHLDRRGSAGLGFDDDGCNLLDLSYECIHNLGTAHPGRYVERKPCMTVEVSGDIRVTARQSLYRDFRVRGVSVNPQPEEAWPFVRWILVDLPTHSDCHVRAARREFHIPTPLEVGVLPGRK